MQPGLPSAQDEWMGHQLASQEATGLIPSLTTHLGHLLRPSSQLETR